MQAKIKGGLISCPYRDEDYDMDYVIATMEEETHDMRIHKQEFGLRLVVR